MEKWLMFGLLASLCYGTYVIFQKVATSDKYFGMSSSAYLLLMLIGLAVVFIGSALVDRSTLALPSNPYALAVAIGAGILAGIGILSVTLALSGGANVAQLVPIFNSNTLVAVILGIIFLHELPNPSGQAKIIAGALLIVIGGILVSG